MSRDILFAIGKISNSITFVAGFVFFLSSSNENVNSMKVKSIIR